MILFGIVINNKMQVVRWLLANSVPFKGRVFLDAAGQMFLIVVQW